MIVAVMAFSLALQGTVDYRDVIADIDNYSWIRHEQRNALRRGGDRAFELLHPIVIRRLNDNEQSERLVEALCECASISRSPQMRDLWNRAGRQVSKDRLIGWLARTGDASANGAIIEDRLVVLAKGGARSGGPLGYVPRSEDLVSHVVD